MAEFYIGTSGYSYKDWEGEFYPNNIKANQYLEYYSKFFNTVEINSTYYSLPNSYFFGSILRKTPENFLFSCKAHSSMTHSRTADDAVFKNFLNALDTLVKSDSFLVVLFQFPYSFYFSDANISYIEKLKKKFKEINMVCEFRNSSWIKDKTLKILEELNIGFCNVDEPRLPKLLPATNFATSEVFYLRFHGRNALNWWNHDESFERYDYMYKEEELTEWLPRISEASKKVKKVLIYFNNHYKAKSVKSADLLKNLLNSSKEE